MGSTLAATALLVVVLSGPSSAHQGDRVFPIYELPTSDLPDLHGGTLVDWEDVLPDASLDYNDLNAIGDVTQVPEPTDLAVRVFLAWHNGSQRVFVGVEWVDDIAFPGGPTGESISVMLDGDHSGGVYRFFSREQYSKAEGKLLEQSQAQSYNVGVIPWPGTEESIVHPGPSFPWVAVRPWSDVGRVQKGESPSHVVIEMHFTPWDQLNWEGPEQSQRTVLEAGKIIGFQLEVWDSDELQSILISTIGEDSPSGATGAAAKNAELFADGELIPCYRDDCSGASTSVSQDSWGRIKASFR